MKRDKQIAERVKKGNLPEFDRTDNQRAVLQRQQQLLTSERQVKAAAFQLALFYQDANGEPVDVSAFKSLARIPQPLFVSQSSVDAPLQGGA
jgi:hypothetical protein